MNKKMSCVLTIAIFVLVIILVTLLLVYIRHLYCIRNESEYRDIMEYQTMLVAALLHNQPSLLPLIGSIRFFPDQSGFFIVLNYQGKLLAHGDANIPSQPDEELPFFFPSDDIVDIAKSGGGYLRYNYKGHVYQSFIHAHPHSPYIVCSGIFSDTNHINKRNNWKRSDKTLVRVGANSGKKRNRQALGI
jgi:hypothetical protein